jgi:hypothetical protein
LQHALSTQCNIYLLLERMEARRRVEFTGGNGLAALGGGGGCTTWKGDIGHTTWKGGISLATRLGGSDRMTGRGQQHAAPSKARS